jgi:hypothetical protein
MRRSVLFPILLLFLFISGIMCQPRQVDPTPIGILVIDTVCSHLVIQLVEGTVNGSRVEPEWKNPNTNIVYVNAFTVANPCSFARNGLHVGDKFSFAFDDAAPADTCVICQIYYPTPSVANIVKNVHKIH